MLNIVSGLRGAAVDVAAALLCSCRTTLQQQVQQPASGIEQHSWWLAQHYTADAAATNVAEEPPGKIRPPKFIEPDPKAFAAKLQDAVPVQPTHRILKVVMQSDIPLTSIELYDKVREEYGPEAFPTRRGFKQQLGKLHHLHWIKARPPPAELLRSKPQPADGATVQEVRKAKGKKMGPVSQPSYVYYLTHKGVEVDLNAPAPIQQMEARAIADKWTQRNLPQYTELIEKGRVPVRADNLGLISRDRRALFAKRLK